MVGALRCQGGVVVFVHCSARVPRLHMSARALASLAHTPPACKLLSLTWTDAITLRVGQALEAYTCSSALQPASSGGAPSTLPRLLQKVDVWGAGIVLYTLLYGQLPFEPSRPDIFAEHDERRRPPPPDRQVSSSTALSGVSGAVSCAGVAWRRAEYLHPAQRGAGACLAVAAIRTTGWNKEAFFARHPKQE